MVKPRSASPAIAILLPAIGDFEKGRAVGPGSGVDTMAALGLPRAETNPPCKSQARAG